jgi:hypothetical protein
MPVTEQKLVFKTHTNRIHIDEKWFFLDDLRKNVVGFSDFSDTLDVNRTVVFRTAEIDYLISFIVS